MLYCIETKNEKKIILGLFKGSTRLVSIDSCFY